MADDKQILIDRLIETFSKFHRMNWRKNLEAGLKPGELMVMFCIKRKDIEASAGIKVSDISSLLNIAAPTVTQVMNSLEDRAFVQRSVDKEDRRAVRVKLTDKGAESIADVYEAFIDKFKGLVDFLGEEETLHLTELLTKVSCYMQEKNKEEC